MVAIPESAPARWIHEPAELDDWLNAGDGEWLALDTEFERVSTFFPIPGLVQLGLGQQFCLVDPSVAERSPVFREILADPDRPKLLYAMSEDLELFRHWLGLEPAGLLDLQIGAALAGAGFSVGYARLVETLFGHTLDKSATRSDWLSRPLTEAQERYALDDVRFLKPLYRWVMDKLQVRGLADALKEESNRFADDLNSQVESDQYYLKIRGGWRLSPTRQGVLKALADWRELECRRRDRPRSRVLSDNALINIADRAPASTGALASAPDVPPVVVRRYGDLLLETVRQALVEPALNIEVIVPPLTRDEQGIYKQIKRLLADAAQQHQVPVELVAPRRRIEALVQAGGGEQELADSLLFQGWRQALTEPVKDEIRALLVRGSQSY
ncbi:MAG: HRDC domain-containing protein [Oleiphilaceae bacterium]|nr:HRDC domain-containing protein [Oleiphilaceae bacterium]